MLAHRRVGYLLGDVPTDGATPAQRARMTWLASQLHALGLSIQQAQGRGDTATVTQLRALVDKLYAEQLSLQKTIIGQTNAIKKTAESGGYDSGLERFASALKSYGTVGLVLGVGILSYLALRK